MRIITMQTGYIFESDEEKKASAIRKVRAALESIEYNLVPGEDRISKGITVSVTGDQALTLLTSGIDIKIVGETKFREGLDGLGGMIDRLQTLVEKVESAPSLGSGDVTYNERCEVHTPGMGLMLFNQTLLLEDCCSDELQTALDNGWRIIAACPQNNQRRPDYILGRYNPEHEHADSRAKRSV